MAKKIKLRKYLFVDPKVQGALLIRVVVYWIVCLASITMMILCWRIITGPARMFYTHFDDMWFNFGPALVGAFLLMPLVLFDIVRLSNRFAGPLLRLRRSLRALAQGEEVAPLEFREGDFWQDFAREFNAVASRMNKLNQAAPSGNIDDDAVLAGTKDRQSRSI
jgi:hypothetical protein